MNNANQHIPAGYKPSPLGIIPEDWENPESWNEDSIYVFMQTCGKYVYEQVYDYDDIFLDGVRETPVTIQY